jgi:hypothetical protein
MLPCCFQVSLSQQQGQAGRLPGTGLPGVLETGGCKELGTSEPMVCRCPAPSVCRHEQPDNYCIGQILSCQSRLVVHSPKMARVVRVTIWAPAPGLLHGDRDQLCQETRPVLWALWILALSK